jgi:hypothetical protein
MQLASGKALTPVKAVQEKTVIHTVIDVQDLFKLRATEKSNYQSLYHFVDPSK